MFGSLFKHRKPREFSYRPRYYNPETGEACSKEAHVTGSHIRGAFTDSQERRRLKHQEKQSVVATLQELLLKITNFFNKKRG